MLLTEVADVVLLLLLLALFRLGRVEVTWELGRAGVIKGLRVGQRWRCVVVLKAIHPAGCDALCNMSTGPNIIP